MMSLSKWMDTIYTLVKAPISKPVEMGKGKKLLILANGPSAGEFWNKEEVREKFASYDLMCMNHAIYRAEEGVFKYKPRFFILLDPVFLVGRQNESCEEKEFSESVRKKLYGVLNKVDWKAYFITNFHGDLALKNDNLTVIRLNQNTILPKKTRYYKLYKNNIANPGINTVLDGAIFFGVTYGYEEIALLGTEFSFFKDIMVDENNMILNHYQHFYKEKYEGAIVRSATHYTPDGSMVAYYLRKMGDNFERFVELNKYAEFYHCKIYNYTKESMIDAFERKQIIT